MTELSQSRPIQEEVDRLREEFDLAVIFHEVWKPSAYDAGVHSMMGASYATNAFLVIRTALRREMLLALMRVWDKNPKAAKLSSVVEHLKSGNTIKELAEERASGWPGLEEEMVADFKKQFGKVQAIFAKYYQQGGSSHTVFRRMRTLRDEHLAHSQLKPTLTGPSATDEEIEEFYQDTSKAVQALMSLVRATAYNPQDTADLYRRHSQLFWAGVRGEKTEGHPNYRRWVG